MTDHEENFPHRSVDQDRQSGNDTDRHDQDGRPGHDADEPKPQRANANSNDRDKTALQFKGNRELLELLSELYPRLGRDQRENRPLICLVRHPNQPAILPKIHELTKSGLAITEELNLDPWQPPPDDKLGPPPTAEEVDRVRALLVRLARSLGQADEPIRRFRRFALATWLMNQELDGGAVDQHSRERTMRALLRTGNRYELTDIPNDLGVPAWLRIAAVSVAKILYRARISGRIPVLSGHYRWFVRRDSLAPRRAGGMPSVAIELTKTAWPAQPNTTLLFLVNSFIEDIRAAYRSPFRRIFGTRRTSRCLIFISNITRRNGGYHLLRAINEVRNLTGLRDPLLVVTESNRKPPFAEPPDGIGSVSGADQEYSAWLEDLAIARDKKEPAAWFLQLLVPPVPESDTRRREHRVNLRSHSLVAPREPHYRKAARLGSMAAVAAGIVFGYAWWSHAHCGNGLSWPGLSPTVSKVGSECVGLSDDPIVLFSPRDEPIRQLAQQVRNLNVEVQTRHDQQSTRPVITLVYLGALSAPGPNTGALAAEVEGLKGVAVAQRRQLDTSGSTEPLVRVLFANAGQRMASGPMVAATIGAAARSDQRLVGVVGLNQSFRATEDTVNALASQGIPTVAATLSADFLADHLQMYFQIAPQNRREAAVAAAYAAQHTPPGNPAARAARIYFSDDASDIYSSNLATDAVAEFRDKGFDVKTITFTPDGNTPASTPPSADIHLANAAQAGADACNFPGLVFYAGRALPDFGSFLGSARNCMKPPLIIADDDTTRHVANDLARRLYPSIPFNYLAFSATTPEQAQRGPEQDFYRSYDEMFSSGKTLDGYAALAYDAVQTFVASIQKLRSGGPALPISPGTVWRQVSAITGPGLRGASGYIDFGGRIDRRVPLNKPVLVMKVVNGEVQPEAEYCGPPPSQDQRTQPWCPVTE